MFVVDKSDVLIAVVTNFFRIQIVWRFMRLFFSVEEGKERLEKVGYVLYFLATTLIFLIFQKVQYNFLVNLGGLLLLSSCYYGKWKKRILISILVYGTNMGCDIIAAFLFYDYTVGDSLSQLFSIVTDLLILSCEIIAEKIVKDRGKTNADSLGITLLVVPGISMVMYLSLLFANLENRSLLIIESISILIINFVIIYIYDKISDTYLKMRQQDLRNQQIELYKNQIDIMTQNEKKIRGLRHDLKHHVREIRKMAEEENCHDILAYLEQMHTFVQNPKEYIASGNKEIDAIINYILGQAESDLVEIDVKASIPEDTKIETFAVNVVLGNLLENALEAAKESKEKKVRVRISVDKGVMYLVIVNSYDGVVIEDNGLKSKKAGENHGFGLNNVREMVQSCHGTIRVEYNDRYFRVDTMLYI